MLPLCPALTFLLLIQRPPPILSREDVSCYPPRPCQIPLLSLNPATLPCGSGRLPPGPVSWFYLNSSEPEAGLVRLVGQGQGQGPAADGSPQPRFRLQNNNLLIQSPTLSDAGVYLCRRGNKTLAYYQADIQDVLQMHVSGGRSGGSELPRLSLDVGGKRLQAFTVWSPWQQCDRCGGPGHRRRLGYCYARPGGGGEGQPVPCGLLLGPRAGGRRGPELSLGSCQVPCVTGSPEAADLRRLQLPGEGLVLVNETRALLFETYLVNVQGNATFRCPGAFIYQPVSWQRVSPPARGRGSRRPPAGTHWLDQSTGGSTYTITGAQTSDQGLYRCFVSKKLAASFHLRVFNPFRRLKAEATNSMKLIWCTLAAIALLSLLLVFLTFVATYCSHTRRHQVVHW
ncbi:protein FAM187B-like [Cetorhinus maximus]